MMTRDRHTINIHAMSTPKSF